jgi:hypothetical protein
MAFSFSKPTAEYRDAVLTVIDDIYDITLSYFIKKSPKEIVAELNQDKYFDHTILIEQIIEQVKRNQQKHNLSVFSESLIHIITKLYYCIFGDNADQMNSFIYLKKGKGWCERYFPPSDSDMYKFIVERITTETKRQYTNPIKL